MPTADEELQAKEFLKRAEIRTMKKDLRALRETDALSERDKIIKLKTLEEQIAEKNKAEQLAANKALSDKASLEEVLTKNEKQERIAEKDLKNYATEEERQQIFILESQRLALEKQIDDIDTRKDPALKLEKNDLLLQRGDQEAKLASILEQEKKIENEQKFVVEQERGSSIPAQKKGLEQTRSDLDKKLQEIEKKRWEVEKQVQNIDSKMTEIDKSSEQLSIEKNDLRNKVLGADKSLREIYSAVMFREEEKRRGQTEAEMARKEALARAKAVENERIQRQQRPGAPKIESPQIVVPIPPRKKVVKIFDIEAEKKQREQFIQDIAASSEPRQGREKSSNNKI